VDNNAVLKTDKLSKWYGNILGISEISLELTDGVYGILGPNGAGKSTFLKIISGQLKQNLGQIEIFGQRVFNNPEIFKKMGFCAELDSFYKNVSGFEFLTFIARLHRFEKKTAQKKALESLEKIGLIDNKDKLISSYSLGMRQRIRIAASIIHSPAILLLDEPLRGVDPLWRVKIIDIIKEYKDLGKTVIVSSHILPEIESMTNHITLIHQGKIFAHGDIQQIRNLIDSHPHQISISCSNPRHLANELLTTPCIKSLEISKEEDKVIFQTNQRDIFFANLMGTLAAGTFSVREISSPDDNLQAVFDYLIGE
jgi:ABC-2 type transport system ATP-binding protein